MKFEIYVELIKDLTRPAVRSNRETIKTKIYKLDELIDTIRRVLTQKNVKESNIFAFKVYPKKSLLDLFTNGEPLPSIH